MEEKADFSKCRLCLEEIDEHELAFGLFTEHKDGKQQNEREDAKMLYEKVQICCGVRIRESAEMPTNICSKCCEITRVWFNFRQMVLNSQIYLESMCTDRNIPPEICSDERKYVAYLMEDLQIVKDVFQRSIEDYDEHYDEINDDAKNFCYDDDVDDDNDGDISDENILLVKNEIDIDDSEDEVERMLQTLNTNGEGVLTTTIESAKKDRKTQKLKKRNLSNSPSKRATSPSNTYMCTICGNVYRKRASFKNHMNIHSNIKPHNCEICNKAFRQVSELKNHMRRHTGEKPHQCGFCERRFIDRSEKHRHERVHTNTRPYKCNVCDKSFAYSTILKNHLKLHSGEKDFHCLVCKKYFALQHQLKAHLQTITHKQKEAKFVEAGYDVIYQ